MTVGLNRIKYLDKLKHMKVKIYLLWLDCLSGRYYVNFPTFHLDQCLHLKNISTLEFSIWGEFSNRIHFFSATHSLHNLSQVAAEGASLWMEYVTLGWKPRSLNSQTFVERQVPFLLSLCLRLWACVWNLEIISQKLIPGKKMLAGGCP